MSVSPGSPRGLPIHLRPEALGGAGRVPVFAIVRETLGADVVFRPDERKPDRHGFVEPAVVMMLDKYQSALFQTAPNWRTC